ncbi:hypothetical protein, partial [Escherichia coli]|uniref:hypothetical protein n=1 Tax=Escherichia coli TaxID=562 RepID=UPI0028DEFE66
GVTWDQAALASRVRFSGTAGADSLYGSSDEANRMYGLDGNDYLFGGNKDDMLFGGRGADSLSGGAGNDTYVFNLGDGVDTISDYDTTAGNT